MSDPRAEEARDDETPRRNVPPPPPTPDPQAEATGGENASETADRALTPPRRRAGATCWAARIALVLYVALLVWLASGNDPPRLSLHMEDLLRPGHWIARAARAAAVTGSGFLLAGLLAALATCRGSHPLGFWQALGRWLGIVLGSVVGLAFATVAAPGLAPGIARTAIALVGVMAGAWIGIAVLRGRRAVLRLVLQAATVVLLVCAGTAGLVVLATDDEPLGFQPPKVTSAEKRRLADVLQNSRSEEEGLRQLRLSQYDVNLMLAMAVPQAPWPGKAQVRINDGTLHGDVSVEIADGTKWTRFVNVRVACQVEVTDGVSDIRLQRCHVGWVPVPPVLLEGILPPLTSAIREDPDFQAGLSAIRRVRVEGDGVSVAFRSGQGLAEKTIPSLISRLGGKPDVLARTRLYYRHLVRTAEQPPTGEPFEEFLQAAFQLAQQRSRNGDPTLENRAAILALGILLGHWRVESLVGPVTDRRPPTAVRRRLGQACLRGRRDWCQHFLVSASLAVASNESLSDQAGILKEELDAGKGGSGFSFGDLLADRAGTQFALAAIRDEQSARRLQSRLAGGFQIDEVFPPGDGLPEGIPDPTFQADYGGVGGEKYKELLAEIERRLTTCSATR